MSRPIEDYLLYDWPFAALVLGSTLFAVAMAEHFRKRNDLCWYQDYPYLCQLGLPLYMVHQFEEHGYDVNLEVSDSRSRAAALACMSSCAADTWAGFLGRLRNIRAHAKQICLAVPNERPPMCFPLPMRMSRRNLTLVYHRPPSATRSAGSSAECWGLRIRTPALPRPSLSLLV